MNSSEASVVARKVKNFITIENQHLVKETEEPGVLKNIALISLMAMSVLFTKLTLLTVRWTKQLENA